MAIVRRAERMSSKFSIIPTPSSSDTRSFSKLMQKLSGFRWFLHSDVVFRSLRQSSLAKPLGSHHRMAACPYCISTRSSSPAKIHPTTPHRCAETAQHSRMIPSCAKGVGDASPTRECMKEALSAHMHHLPYGLLMPIVPRLFRTPPIVAYKSKRETEIIAQV